MEIDRIIAVGIDPVQPFCFFVRLSHRTIDRLSIYLAIRSRTVVYLLRKRASLRKSVSSSVYFLFL